MPCTDSKGSSCWNFYSLVTKHSVHSRQSTEQVKATSTQYGMLVIYEYESRLSELNYYEGGSSETQREFNSKFPGEIPSILTLTKCLSTETISADEKLPLEEGSSTGSRCNYQFLLRIDNIETLTGRLPELRQPPVLRMRSAGRAPSHRT